MSNGGVGRRDVGTPGQWARTVDEAIPFEGSTPGHWTRVVGRHTEGDEVNIELWCPLTRRVVLVKVLRVWPVPRGEQWWCIDDLDQIQES